MQADDWGRRATAAFLIYLQRAGTGSVSLASIVGQMPIPGSIASRSFLSHLNRVMWVAGQHYSAKQIANDVEAAIAESHRMDAEDPSATADMQERVR